ncbi:MAG TPA: efflux RND transporter periplasmic adaptor subunit [Gemmataceae bacterium]
MNQLKVEHPGAAELVAFGLGQLDEGLGLEVEAHLAACESCRSAVDSAPTDAFVAKIKSAFASTREDSQRSAGGDGLRTETLPPRGVATDIPADLAGHSRYRLLELLGAGGMGAVFKAEHLLMKRTVAVKVINRALFTDPAVAERFGREMEAAGKLTHPNIVHAYDAERIGDTHFLAMEYVEGLSLAKLLAQRGPLPVTEACSYIRQAALGLQHAHERGMVHRDIKPQNLMVTSRGQVKILDFGLARFVLESAPPGALLASTGAAIAPAQGEVAVETLTQVGTLMGTPAYIAPEQARDPHSADIRADIYSLGCTLYDLLTGRPPFPEGTVRRKVIGHLREEPRSLLELRPDAPRELAQVVDKMLAKEPAQRYQVPAEVADALRPWVEDTEIGEGRSPNRDSQHVDRPPSPAGLPPTLAGPRRRRRGRLGFAASIAVVLGVLGCLFVPPIQDFAQTVIRVATNKGVLIIEAEDEDLEISIRRDGADQSVLARVAKGSKEVIELRAGELTIDARLPGGDCLKTTELTLARGGKRLLSARLLLTPQVLVSRPVERQVTDYEEFSGRTDATEAVHVKPRVSGYLQKVTFREGNLVQRGQVLFEIDPKPIQILLEKARARAKSYEAQLKEKTAKSVEATLADLKAVEAEIKQRTFELSFTKVTAPISGRVGRLYLKAGNQVTADETMLTSIVSEDPMSVYFDVPEATALRLRPLLQPTAEVFIRLANEKDYRHKAVIDFVNNRVDNGSLAARAKLPNPRLPGGNRLLTPGLFVRIRLLVGPPHPALLVKVPGSEAASGAPSQDFLYVVDDQNKVVRRRVKWGQEHDGLREVREGLKPGERVIVGWTEVPRPGEIVQAKWVEMPGSQPESAAPK